MSDSVEVPWRPSGTTKAPRGWVFRMRAEHGLPPVNKEEEKKRREMGLVEANEPSSG